MLKFESIDFFEEVLWLKHHCNHDLDGFFKYAAEKGVPVVFSRASYPGEHRILITNNRLDEVISGIEDELLKVVLSQLFLHDL